MPLPISLVVKKGSKIFFCSSAAMPEPVSVTAIITYCPATSSGSCTACSLETTAFDTAIVSLPPAGMASRELVARFMMACSNWPGSATHGQRSAATAVSTEITSPKLRRSMSSRLPISSPASITFA